MCLRGAGTMIRMENETKEQIEAQPAGEEEAYGNYRKLGQPADTVSGATQELFEVRPSGSSANGAGDGSSTAFKVIAVVAIVSVVLAIAATQFGVVLW